MEVEKLLLKIHAGKRPSESELEELVSLLSRVRADELVGSGVVDDVYSALLVICRGKFVELGHLAAKFLDSHDSLTVSLVLETLCSEWGIYDEYFERIVDFALGVSWDKDADVRQTALKILGEYLRIRLDLLRAETEECKRPSARVVKVIELLLGIIDDADANAEVRTAAYAACRRGLGALPEDLPNQGEEIELPVEKLAELQPLRAFVRDSEEKGCSGESSKLSGVSLGKFSPGIR